MIDIVISSIFQGVLGYIILPYVLWKLTHKSHKLSNKSDLFKYLFIFEALMTLYFILPDFLKLLFLVSISFGMNHMFFKLNWMQSFLTSFIFLVIFITSEIVSEMISQIANIIIGNITAEIGFLTSIKYALQFLICFWMIRSFEEEFSTIIVKRGAQN